jgi:hypothetical protein
LLEQFSAAGGTTKEVEMDWELYGWKPRDMTDCDQYSAFKRFMEVNKGEVRHSLQGKKTIY